MLILEPPGKPVPTHQLLSVAQGLRMSPERLFYISESSFHYLNPLLLPVNREENSGDRVKAQFSWGSISASTMTWEGTPAMVFPVGRTSLLILPWRGLGSFLLPQQILHFSAEEDGGWGLSLMRWVKHCDWAVSSPTAAAAARFLHKPALTLPPQAPGLSIH